MNIDTVPFYHIADATVGSTRIKKEVIESNEFLAAKSGDESAATNIIRATWNDKKSAIFKSEMEGEIFVFISQPSTTGANILPAKFAEHLGNITGSKAINGDDQYSSLHTASSKNIPRDKRVFNPREYESVDLDALKKEVGNRQVFIVEDILNTGGSVRAFSERLKTDGFDVLGVVALMGDRRLSLDRKTTSLLNDALEKKGMDFKADGLQITRQEAGGLIRMSNNIRGEHEREELARNLQGLQDRQIVADIRRDPQQPPRNIGDEGGNKNHANVDKGVQVDSGASTHLEKSINSKDRHFVVSDDSGRILNTNGNFKDDAANHTFDKPSVALDVAYQKRVEHSKELEGTALYVHRVEQGEIIGKPFLKTMDSPDALKKLWSRQMGENNPVPDNLIKQAGPVSLEISGRDDFSL